MKKLLAHELANTPRDQSKVDFHPLFRKMEPPVIPRKAGLENAAEIKPNEQVK